MVVAIDRGTYGGEYPFRPKTLNTPARTHNNANIRMHKCKNMPAPTVAQLPASGSSHEAAGAPAAALPPGLSVAMAPSPACPSGSVSAAIASPSGSSPAVARGFDLAGVLVGNCIAFHFESSYLNGIRVFLHRNWFQCHLVRSGDPKNQLR